MEQYRAVQVVNRIYAAFFETLMYPEPMHEKIVVPVGSSGLILKVVPMNVRMSRRYWIVYCVRPDPIRTRDKSSGQSVIRSRHMD